MPITEYNVFALMFITVVAVFSMVIMIHIEDFYRSRRTKTTHPHHIHHKHFSEEPEMLPTKNYVYSLIHKKKTPAYIKDKLVAQGWKEHEAHDAVRHYTEQYLREKSKGRLSGRPKVLFRKRIKKK